MKFGQRELMRQLYEKHVGDKALVIQEYVQFDEQGLVQRKRDDNKTSSREYAIRLWANGMYHGWLGEPFEIKPKQITKSATVGSKFIVEELDEFEVALEQLGRAWQCDPRRPHPSPESLTYWSALISDWCADPQMPLLVRKGSTRAVKRVHRSGRVVIPCDNSPAHWAFLGCYKGAEPTLADVLEQLQSGTLPLAMARSREEKALVDVGEVEAVGGFIAKSAYGQVNRFPDGKQYKLCHLEGIGLRVRGTAESLDEMILRRHMRQFLDPTNMIVVPKRYSGIGECPPFLRPFLKAKN